MGKRGGDLEGDVSGQWTRKGFFVFLLGFFLTGMALAMTPCVLPIIPITVSIIGGGRADLSRGRLTFLLSCYVAGLALAFGTMGVAAALTGESLSAAFQSPVAIWVIAGLFVLLSLGMFGIFELQPPAFLQRLQGGAKGGNPLGAFGFGAISAVLASPCTGPVIAGALIFTAQAGNTLTGFLVFFTIGLGMGAVFFAAGSLNLLMRPGPWMVWVRYVFGILMVAGALYYLASSGKVSGTAIFALGFALAALIGVAVGRHLATKEGETVTAAAVRATKVAVLLALATGTVAFLTRQPETEALRWTNVTSREQLVAEVAKARARGQATVVDVWATWCNYCRQYDRVIERDARLLAEFEKLHRVRMDLSHEERPWEEGLREGLGIPGNTQPFMVFIDREGRIRGPLDVVKWMGEQSTQGLRDRVQAVYEPPTGEAASAGGS